MKTGAFSSCLISQDATRASARGCIGMCPGSWLQHGCRLWVSQDGLHQTHLRGRPNSRGRELDCDKGWSQWKALRLVLALALCVPAFALLGAFATLDSGERGPWFGMAGGAVVGLFFGLGVGGFRPHWFARLFGAPDKEGD
jgi:hypothetical protein